MGGLVLVVLLMISLGGVLIANPQWGRRSRDWREVGRQGVPTWEVEQKFGKDVFTFVRIKYDSSGYRRGNGWSTDFRDSELIFLASIATAHDDQSQPRTHRF